VVIVVEVVLLRLFLEVDWVAMGVILIVMAKIEFMAKITIFTTSLLRITEAARPPQR
jgi:hypothetical protein